MVSLQILNRVISTKDISIITDNNLTIDYFLEYEDEYSFIKEHFDNYKNVPDTETFINKFPDFELLEVNIDTLELKKLKDSVYEYLEKRIKELC